MPLLYIQEGFNLFVGDNGPDNEKRLNLESLKLPELEENTVSVNPGGAIGEITVGGMGLKALESSFKITGWDPQTMSQFGLGQTAQLPYTIYGVVRDKNGNAPMQVKAILRARLTALTPDELKRGDNFGHNYALKEVLHYELYFNKVEKYYYDFLSTTWRVDGIDPYAAERALLGITS